MQRSYQIASKTDTGKIADYLACNGQLLMPMADLWPRRKTSGKSRACKDLWMLKVRPDEPVVDTGKKAA